MIYYNMVYETMNPVRFSRNHKVRAITAFSGH